MSRTHVGKIPALTLLALLWVSAPCHAQSPPGPPELGQLLTKLATETPDPCETSASSPDSPDLEAKIFTDAEEQVIAALNTSPEKAAGASKAAEEVLARVESQSGKANIRWPEENRFHYKLLGLPPILVLKLTLRTQARFVVFAIPPGSSNTPNRLWRQVGSDDLSFEHESPRSWLDLYPLERGPSGNARFLASLGYTGCAGSFGVVYDVREWNPQDGTGHVEQIIKQEGAFGLDQAPQGRQPTSKDPFPAVGVLRTTGHLISLPYCWFSAIDTWDNPSLCSLDTYDLSGDIVAFRSRVFNRPDLVPVAKAIEFADKHDYPATRAYRASDALAQRLIRTSPPHADDLEVKRKGNRAEVVEMSSTQFRVEKRGGRWILVSFSDR